jgi:hypothetical protein
MGATPACAKGASAGITVSPRGTTAKAVIAKFEAAHAVNDVGT